MARTPSISRITKYVSSSNLTSITDHVEDDEQMLNANYLEEHQRISEMDIARDEEQDKHEAHLRQVEEQFIDYLAGEEVDKENAVKSLSVRPVIPIKSSMNASRPMSDGVKQTDVTDQPIDLEENPELVKLLQESKVVDALDWITDIHESYKQNYSSDKDLKRSPQLHSLIDLIFAAASMPLPSWQSSCNTDAEPPAIITSMQDLMIKALKAEGAHGSYKLAELKIFRTAFESFWDKLGQDCTPMHLLPHLIPWLICLSSAAFRPLRMAGTTAALTFLTGMARFSVGKERRRGDVLPLDQPLQSLFDGVFVQRYRDIDPQIREFCLIRLSIWIMEIPSAFLDNSYLRYLGWSLSDRAPKARKQAVSSFKALFKPDRGGKCWRVPYVTAFLDRFKERLLEMACRDVDDGVRSQAVQCLVSVQETMGPGLFDLAKVVRHLLKSKDTVALKHAKPLLINFLRQELKDKEGKEDSAVESALAIATLATVLPPELGSFEVLTIAAGVVGPELLNLETLVKLIKARICFISLLHQEQQEGDTKSTWPQREALEFVDFFDGNEKVLDNLTQDQIDMLLITPSIAPLLSIFKGLTKHAENSLTQALVDAVLGSPLLLIQDWPAVDQLINCCQGHLNLIEQIFKGSKHPNNAQHALDMLLEQFKKDKLDDQNLVLERIARELIEQGESIVPLSVLSKAWTPSVDQSLIDALKDQAITLQASLASADSFSFIDPSHLLTLSGTLIFLYNVTMWQIKDALETKTFSDATCQLDYCRMRDTLVRWTSSTLGFKAVTAALSVNLMENIQRDEDEPVSIDQGQLLCQSLLWTLAWLCSAVLSDLVLVSCSPALQGRLDPNWFHDNLSDNTAPLFALLPLHSVNPGLLPSEQWIKLMAMACKLLIHAPPLDQKTLNHAITSILTSITPETQPLVKAAIESDACSQTPASIYKDVMLQSTKIDHVTLIKTLVATKSELSCTLLKAIMSMANDQLLTTCSPLLLSYLSPSERTLCLTELERMHNAKIQNKRQYPGYFTLARTLRRKKQDTKTKQRAKEQIETVLDHNVDDDQTTTVSFDLKGDENEVPIYSMAIDQGPLSIHHRGMPLPSSSAAHSRSSISMMDNNPFEENPFYVANASLEKHARTMDADVEMDKENVAPAKKEVSSRITKKRKLMPADQSLCDDEGADALLNDLKSSTKKAKANVTTSIASSNDHALFEQGLKERLSKRPRRQHIQL